jgi:hypothetical protein
MQVAMAIDRTQKRHCLAGQYRFTEWTTQEAAHEAVREALAALAPKGIEVIDFNARNGVVSAKVKYSLIPPEIISWFTHFERKGIPAAIVKMRNSDEYAVLRYGVDHSAEDDEEPEILSKTDIYVLRKCHGFKLGTEEY